MRLLDVGCGFGSLLMHAAEHFGVTAVGMVRSADAADLARGRCADAGLSDRVEVRLGDFTGVVDGPYDAVAAMETAEFLPADELGDYAATLQSLLRPGGRLFLQQVTGLAGSGDASSAMSPYLYQAGSLVAIGSIVGALDDAGLEVRTVQSRREHYPPTLQAWLGNLESHWAEAVEVVGESKARLWRLSLALSTVGFERGRVSVHQILAVRPYADGRIDAPS
jgi:cyclopropane-fatty-acyl-phospholipid synthase